MIIIPEREIVLILVPRTGSGSLRRAVKARYPQAMQLYRHMEADGVPQGYDRWERFGVVRSPLDRLWSLYKFLQRFDHPHEPAYVAALRKSAERTFEDYVRHNETVFTRPYSHEDPKRFYPAYNVRHPLPENRKSQWLYLRPDLGTHIITYGNLAWLTHHLDVQLDRFNATGISPVPSLGEETMAYMRRTFAWDYEVTRGGA